MLSYSTRNLIPCLYRIGWCVGLADNVSSELEKLVVARNNLDDIGVILCIGILREMGRRKLGRRMLS